MEAFYPGLFPGRSGFDVERFDLLVLQPVLQDVGDELRAVVTPKVIGDSVDLHRVFDDANGIGRTDGPAGVEGETLTSVFVD